MFVDGGALDSQTTDSQFVRGLGSETGLRSKAIANDNGTFPLSQPRADDKKEVINADATNGVVRRVANAKASPPVPCDHDASSNDRKLSMLFPDSSSLDITESYSVADDTSHHIAPLEEPSGI